MLNYRFEALIYVFQKGLAVDDTGGSLFNARLLRKNVALLRLGRRRVFDQRRFFH